MSLWVHSDWHWRHENIYRFVYMRHGRERRVRERFADAKEGDAFIEQAIRDVVKEKDTLLFLGDLTMFRDNYHAAEFIALMKSLPGTKWFIPGNHDHYPAKHYVEAGFKKIRGSMQVDGILFSHFPLHESTLYRAKVNAHGHIHQNDSPSPKHFNCSVEVSGYAPVHIDTIQHYVRERDAHCDDLPSQMG